MEPEAIAAALEELAKAGRWDELRRLGAAALERVLRHEKEARTPTSRAPEEQARRAADEVREYAAEELERDLDAPIVAVIRSREALVDTIAVAARPGFVGIVAGSGDARANAAKFLKMGWRPVKPNDHMPMIFVTHDDQAHALAVGLARAFPEVAGRP